MSDDTCRYCHRTLIEIDHYGEWLIGLACRDQMATTEVQRSI
jgi:hypothetical protein